MRTGRRTGGRTRGKRSPPAAPTRLRYTKAALLVFGLGLAIGFVVAVGEFSQWEYLASSVMALGLVLLPLGIFADGRGVAALGWLAKRFSRRKPGGKRAGAARTGARIRKAGPRLAGSRAQQPARPRRG
jgi:hypothetical protein